MGLFNKKEDIPELPTAPSLPELPVASSSDVLPPKSIEKKDLPGLPSFPNNSKNDGFNQEMVKSAVSDNVPEEKESEDSVGLPELPRKEEVSVPADISPHTFSSGAPPGTPAFPNIPKKSDSVSLPVSSEPKESIMDDHGPTLNSNNPTSPTPIKVSGPKNNDPIFVRIDKFQDSQKKFDEIKKNVGEIENILKKMKDVKAKEDEELKGWTSDVENIKLKLGEIDSNIFSQL